LKFRLILFFVLGFFIFNSLTYTHAQLREVEWDGDELADTAAPQNSKDSLAAAREHSADSARDARERIADSTKTARQQKSDSLNNKRKHIADSASAIRKYHDSKHFKDSTAKAKSTKANAVKDARQAHMDSVKDARKQATQTVQSKRKHGSDSSAAIRKYHDSKHYKDSIERARVAKTNSVKKSRQAHMDSLKDAREIKTDSINTLRTTRTDSIKAVQKKRTDSLASKKKYKTSKRYADSVKIVKQDRTDSIKDAQDASREKMAKTRKHSADSATTARKHAMDSLTAVRTKHLDSVKLVRKTHADSLAKVKKQKEAIAKAKDKKKLDDIKLKLEIKMKQKHEAWSNKSMLKKRWSPIRRLTQNSFTHYNYYYNANRKMDEALLNMQRSRKENYDSLIGLYPFDPNRDSTLMLPDMDSIVRKVSVAIQIHDPRVKWSNDLYLLLGEAFYYKGSYENAAISFRYIISADERAKKEAAKGESSGSKSKDAPTIVDNEQPSRFAFLKHKSVHNEAVLWLARTYTEAHQAENAESVLSLLESDTKLPENLKGRLAIEKAFAYLTEKNEVEASKQLSIAVDDNNLPDWLRQRAAFLNGQILQNQGQYNEAAKSFELVISYYPKIDMDFYSRKYIAYNKLMAGANIEEAVRPLKNILKDGKYLNYYDQVYYALGQMAYKANKPDQAIGYYTKSVTVPRATKKQKAISYSAMGDVFYASARYPNAKMAYDSAAKYASAAGKDKGVAASVARVKGLEEISGPTRVIFEQDSLMELAALSKKDQQAAVRRYLRYLEQKRDDSIRNADALSLTLPTPADPDDAGKPDGGGAGSWYFGNPTLMSQGSDDFKRKWGTRPLTDNWRRAAAISLSSSDAGVDEDVAVAGGTDKETGLPTEASLLARIPNSTAQKENSAKLEQRAYMMLAKAYVKQLEDYTMANNTLDTLDARYPNTNQKEEELYLRYQIAIKQNKLDKAQTYSQELLTKFPKSQYANLLRPRHSEAQADSNSTKAVTGYFDETYTMIMQHQYTEAMMRIEIAKKQYDNPLYQKRFEVAEAMDYAGMGDFDKADTVISHFLHTNPSDTLTPWAASVKEYIKQVRNGGKPAWYYDTIPASKKAAMAKANATPVVPLVPLVPPPPANSTYRIDSPQYCIVVLPGLESRTAGLKQGIRKFNASSDSTAGLNMVFDLYNIDLGVMVIKNFKSAQLAKNYMQALLASPAFNDYKPGELQVMIISGNNYRKMFADKNTQPYAKFYNDSYK
jgi:tetratricopeptide (TPR) repeat protein